MIPRAHGAPLFDGVIRERPEDFRVVEDLGFLPDGGDAHHLLKIEKRDTNTLWLSRQLARTAGVENRDVGYSGLKDRRAVTVQWFSVPSGAAVDWESVRIDGTRILAVENHSRKLRIGSHRANSFEIAIRVAGTISVSAVNERFATIAEWGLPNYFGVQRFGHGNLDMARSLFGGKRLRRDKRSLALSAARSYLFNLILARRVLDGSWNRLLPGERANLDGSNSFFAVDALDAELEQRCAAKDIHPTASLWGQGAPQSTNDVAALEREAVAGEHDLVEGLERAGVKVSQRATRMLLRDADMETDANKLLLRFTLTRGSFATSVLDEIATVRVAEPE